jgi:catechol 2,3-dioxygenase
MGRQFGIPPPSYRLPDAAHVGRVRLQVSDLSRSVDYYENVIGLRSIDRDRATASLGAQQDGVPLVELHERGGVAPVRKLGRLGLYHFALLVPTRAGLGRFVSHIADADVRVSAADHLVSEALYLWDPDGLGIEVYADRPRHAWKTGNGPELAMTTEPLDLHSLHRGGQGEAWNGLPAGTVMGHVHLHVPNLANAEALYHRALGFDKMVWSYPGALFMSAGGYHHHLATNTWAAGAAPAGDHDPRLLEWELVLPTADAVEAAGESLVRSGYDVSREGTDRVVSDDAGTSLRLTARS